MNDPDHRADAENDNPEMTEAEFARARRGAPWLWQTADRLRASAAELRHRADLLDVQADVLDDPAIRRAG